MQIYIHAYQGFPTRMVYLYYVSNLRYNILVGNPQYICTYIHTYICTCVCVCIV